MRKAYVTGHAVINEFQLAIGKEVLSVDPTYFRPTEVDVLDWRPIKSQKQTRLGTRT